MWPKGKTRPEAGRYKKCSVDVCERLVGYNGGHGLCNFHNQRRLRGAQLDAPHRTSLRIGVCEVNGCGQKIYAKSRCVLHYMRQRGGIPDHHKFNTRRFKKSRTKGPDGYMFVLVDGKKRLEHRVVMERKLGRPLLPTETVHHKNGKRADNRILNLELWSTGHPYGQRVKDLIEFAEWVLKTYPPEQKRMFD